WFVERRALRRDLRGRLKGAPDIARALSRLALARGGPRDLAALRDGLARAAETLALFEAAAEPLEGGPPARLAEALAALRPTPGVAALRADLEAGLVAEPPHLARDGGFVAPGFREELDAARRLRDDSRQVIAELEARAQALSGVPLKVKHNAVLGYFLEASA